MEGSEWPADSSSTPLAEWLCFVICMLLHGHRRPCHKHVEYPVLDAFYCMKSLRSVCAPWTGHAISMQYPGLDAFFAGKAHHECMRSIHLHACMHVERMSTDIVSRPFWCTKPPQPHSRVHPKQACTHAVQAVFFFDPKMEKNECAF